VLPKLSIVIPARNEALVFEATLLALVGSLSHEAIPYELVFVDDHSTDATQSILDKLKAKWSTLRPLKNPGRPGFGRAVRAGIDASDGEIVAIFMADGSDLPEDLVRFYRRIQETGVDCIFGSRFIPEGKTVGYPWIKWILNRGANLFIRLLFGITYNDVTNAFKMYRRTTLNGLKPFLSYHFNLTVELPLKAIIRGYSYEVLPNTWINRKAGVSKLKIKEMGSRYLFIVLYCFIEKWLSHGDYRQAREGKGDGR
jgi:dolichol-phosphate mannosyltransferase